MRLLIQCIGDSHTRSLALDVDDPIIELQVLQPGGPWPRHDSDIVVTGACQLEGKGTADFTNTEDSDTEGREALQPFFLMSVG
jgi:hypothetical protein